MSSGRLPKCESTVGISEFESTGEALECLNREMCSISLCCQWGVVGGWGDRSLSVEFDFLKQDMRYFEKYKNDFEKIELAEKCAREDLGWEQEEFGVY